jgi:hypothetical protein
MKEEKIIEEMNELFREHRIGLKELCLWFIYTYPEDIFTGKTWEISEIVAIRENCKKILKQLKVDLR